MRGALFGDFYCVLSAQPGKSFNGGWLMVINTKSDCYIVMHYDYDDGGHYGDSYGAMVA